MLKNIFYFFLFLSIAHCSGSAEEPVDTGSVVNTKKLIGTPFEGLTTGDKFGGYYSFVCGKYRTDTIETFPIKIFSAFFTRDEEQAIIQAGIDIANNGIGFEAYQLTDKWSDDVRVIYKVNEIPGPADATGQTYPVSYYFNDNYFSENLVTDWSILIEQTNMTQWEVAHELGHATGLGHYIIDYTNNTCDSDGLEPNSIMESNGGTELTDYNFMMKKQGKIMKAHLGDTSGTLGSGFCPD